MKKSPAAPTGGKPRNKAKGSGGKADARKPREASAQKQRLERDLAEAIQQIDEEGLLFLLQQAQVLIHNSQVERINREVEELRQSSAEKRGKQSRNRRAADARAGDTRAPRVVRIDETANRKGFFLDLNGVRKALSLQEMQRVVKICYTAESKSAAQRQLYTLFARERGDILADAHVGGPSSPLLDALFYAVREKYRLEER